MATVGPTVTTTVTRTGQITRMSTDAYLTLIQWFSPGFPVGAFAYSHGLEHAIDAGQIATASTLQDWLQDMISGGSGRNDVILLAAAYGADDNGLAEIEATARAFAASEERLTETVDQGHAFARTVDAVWATDLGPLSYPVAVGRAARTQGIPLDLTAELFLHAVVANLISVAVRLVPLGQTEGQAVLARLAPLVRDTAKAAISESTDDIASCCFALDIASMKHETQYSKVFRT